METATAQAVEPGLYRDVPMLDYHAWPGASQSRLKTMRDKSPAHVRWEMEHPQESTPAMRVGAAVHTAVLEPDLFGAAYVRDVEGDGRTKAVKDARAELRAAHPEAIVLAPADYDLCLRVRDVVFAHPIAKYMLVGDSERSAAWLDAESGVLCRGRFDKVATSVGAIVDLKTTVDAAPERFRRSIYTYGYYMQAAHYLAGAKALGVDVDRFGIIAVEKEPPYGVAVYELTGAAVYDGERERRPLLETWARCTESGHWPSYPEEAVLIDLPAYAPAQIDERIGE